MCEFTNCYFPYSDLGQDIISIAIGAPTPKEVFIVCMCVCVRAQFTVSMTCTVSMWRVLYNGIGESSAIH